MTRYKKVVYWDKSWRLVDASKIPQLEQAMVGTKPFRLVHTNGIDLVRPGTIAMITDPKNDELPYVEPKSLPQGEEKVEDPIPEEIMSLCKMSVYASLGKDKAFAKRAREEFKKAGQIYRKYGKIVIDKEVLEGGQKWLRN